MIGPTLETARLILRPPVQADFDGFAAMARETETMRFIGGAAPRDSAWRTMAMLTGSWSLLGYSMFSVIERTTGLWVGRIGPWRPGGMDGNWPGNEIGWGLISSAQHKGYAVEGTMAAIDWAFTALDWTDVVHCIHKANAPSIVVAGRIGSKRLREDVRLPAPYDGTLVDLYGQTKAEWKNR